MRLRVLNSCFQTIFFLFLDMAFQVGTGFIILAVLWIISVVLFVILSRASDGGMFAGFGILILALLITIILWVLPRGDASDEKDYIIYDYNYILRISVLVVTSVFLFVGLISYLLDQFQIVRNKPLGLSNSLWSIVFGWCFRRQMSIMSCKSRLH